MPEINDKFVSDTTEFETLDEYKKHSELFDDDLYGEIDLVNCVEKRISKGSTSVSSVEQQIEYVTEALEND